MKVTLRKKSKSGDEMFKKEYSKGMADNILKMSSHYQTGEEMWEVVAGKAKAAPKAAPKAKAKPKAKPNQKTLDEVIAETLKSEENGNS